MALLLLASSLLFVPSLTLLKKNELQTRVDTLTSAVMVAKTQASASNQGLILAPLAANGDWSEGMRLFLDNTEHRYNSTSQLVQQWHWPHRDINITWHGFQSKAYLLFSPVLSSSAVNGYFFINYKDQHVKLIINRVGRLTTLTHVKNTHIIPAQAGIYF